MRRCPGDDPIGLVEQAWLDYERAARGLLVNEGRAVQQIATVHWVLVQVVCLAAVLGKDFDGERWSPAKFCADLYVAHSDREERAWAHASLAELCLLRLCEPDLDASERERWVRAALAHADELVRAYPSRAEFPVRATLYQFRRYVDWWGTPEFVTALAQRNGARRVSWTECGLLDAATE